MEGEDGGGGKSERFKKQRRWGGKRAGGRGEGVKRVTLAGRGGCWRRSRKKSLPDENEIFHPCVITTIIKGEHVIECVHEVQADFLSLPTHARKRFPCRHAAIFMKLSKG